MKDYAKIPQLKLTSCQTHVGGSQGKYCSSYVTLQLNTFLKIRAFLYCSIFIMWMQTGGLRGRMTLISRPLNSSLDEDADR